MTVSIVGLVVALIIFALIFWVIRTLAAAFNLPNQIVQVLYVLLVVVMILWLLQVFGLLPAAVGLR